MAIKWDEETKKAIWNKGIIKSGYSPDEWRFDECGCLIKYSDFGKGGSIYGWAIDHIIRMPDGGSNDLSNLRPLQWAANLALKPPELPKPPRPPFIDRNLKAGKVVFKEVIREAVVEFVKWLLSGRKRQPVRLTES